MIMRQHQVIPVNEPPHFIRQIKSRGMEYMLLDRFEINGDGLVFVPKKPYRLFREGLDIEESVMAGFAYRVDVETEEDIVPNSLERCQYLAKCWAHPFVCVDSLEDFADDLKFNNGTLVGIDMRPRFFVRTY